MIQVYYMHVWKCHKEITYSVKLIYTDKKRKRGKCSRQMEQLVGLFEGFSFIQLLLAVRSSQI
jgi:hypothetical protein